jgi:hypothetical protein
LHTAPHRVDAFGVLVRAARVEKWCRDTAGQRIHGTTQTRPAEMFAESEAAALLGVPEPYDVPIFTQVKVHRDFHIFSELDQSLRLWGLSVRNPLQE